MADSPLQPISLTEERSRLHRVEAIARSFGFVGRVEYRHVISRTGGALYGLASTPDNDLLSVDARAFQRDADPEDFSLEAMIAHERGHQLLYRHPRMRGLLTQWSARNSEEMMASILGALLVDSVEDRDLLLRKAVFDVVKCGVELDDAVLLVTELQAKMEKIL